MSWPARTTWPRFTVTSWQGVWGVREALAGPEDRAALHGDVGEVGVDAPVAVAVVDHDDDGQVPPAVGRVEARVVRAEIADPADLVVEMTTGREHDAGVGGANGRAAERRHVDAVVEQPSGVVPLAARDRLERQGDPALRDRPDLSRQRRDLRGDPRGPDVVPGRVAGASGVARLIDERRSRRPADAARPGIGRGLGGRTGNATDERLELRRAGRE